VVLSHQTGVRIPVALLGCRRWFPLDFPNLELVFLYAPLVRIRRVLVKSVTLSYVNILVDRLLSVIRFLVFEHVVDDLDELPGEGIHGLPMAFSFSSLSPVILLGLGIDPDLG